MKNFIIVFVLSGFLIIFFGCEKNNPDTDPVGSLTATINPEYDSVFIGTIVPITYSSTADCVEVKTITGTFIMSDPKNGIFRDTVSEPGPSQILFNFFKAGLTPLSKTSWIFGKELPLPERPTIEMPDTLYTSYNTSVEILVTITGANAVISDIPGFSGISGGIYQSPPLTDTTVYHVSASNESGTTVDSMIIFVAPPTYAELIKDTRGWHVISFETRELETEQWDSVYVSPDIINEIKFFHDNNYYEVFRYGVLIGNGVWFFLDNETKLSIGGVVYDIQTLNEENLILTFITPCPGCPNPEVFARLTFVHPLE